LGIGGLLLIYARFLGSLVVVAITTVHLYGHRGQYYNFLRYIYLREGVTMMDNHDILQCWTYINTLGHYYVIVACYNVKHTKWHEGIMLHEYYSG